MKRFLSAVGLCVFLLLFGLFVFLPSTGAEKNLLENLLNLPAPPPPNPLAAGSRRNRPADFLSKNKPPADDAPIEDLLAYWRTINGYDAKYTYTPDASERTLERLRSEIESDPEILPSLINNLPETDEATSFVKSLYDREQTEKKYDQEWTLAVERWLTYHSKYFSDELAQMAAQAGDANEYVTNQDELLALARVDWDKARPILDRLINDSSQPVAQTLARWAFYRRAVRENDSSDIEKYRRELQATVENKSAMPGNRDLAMDALVESGDFEGRDDWYFSLLEDETLHDLRVNGRHYTGLTTLLLHSRSDKYTAKMLELVKSSNRAVRSAAARNLATLLEEKNPEVVRALLPWLDDPEWVTETNEERQKLINALAGIHLPESVPGLIAVLNENPSKRDSSTSTNTNSSTMNTVRRRVGSAGDDFYPYRSEAVGALAAQKDIRAAAALRLVLPEIEEWQRGLVVRAILLSRGFSVPEQIEALELVAKSYSQPPPAYPGNSMSNVAVATVIGEADVPPPPPPPMMPSEMPMVRRAEAVTTMSNMSMSNGNSSVVRRPFDPAEIKPLLGAQLVSQTEAEEDLVTALIERIGVLDAKDPPLAYSLRKIMQSWRGAAVNRLLLRDLKQNKADTDAVVKLLSLRTELRGNQSSEILDARGGNAVALGIAACLLEDASEYDGLLAGENVEAKAAMLGCARLIRAKLPVQTVAQFLRHPNKMLAVAAERYLETEDSPEARQIVLSAHPNEAVVLGARTSFVASDSASAGSEYLPALFASVNDALPVSLEYYIHYRGVGEDGGNLILTERKLRKEVKENLELAGVYAYDDNFVRIYKDKAVFSWQEDKARYRERVLEKEEFDALTGYLASERVDELTPFLSECDGECKSRELLMLGRQGGRRVFSLGEQTPKFFAGLASIFDRMREPPAKLHYWLEKSIGGLEILFEDENLQAETVWKTGDDFRVLINNQARRKQIDTELARQAESDFEQETEDEPDYEKIQEQRRTRSQMRLYENYTWNKFADGRLAGTTEQPNGFENLPKLDAAPIRANRQQWKARAGAFEIRGGEEALYKITGGRATKIRDGYFDKPLVTPNGRWLIVTGYSEEAGRQLLRINLATNKQFAINFDEYPVIETAAFVPALNRVLLFGGGYSERDYETEAGDEEAPTERAGEYFLLDPETGIVQKAKGEVRPLAQQTFRPLQTTGTADEFWAAIPDSKTGDTQVGVYNAKTFAFKSLVKIPQITFGSMEMWVDAGKIYFVYEGHLLGLPLPK